MRMDEMIDGWFTSSIAWDGADDDVTVLGLFREWECSVGECRLEKDDLLALYSPEEQNDDLTLIVARRRNASTRAEA
jgi:hypothetical protein